MNEVVLQNVINWNIAARDRATEAAKTKEGIARKDAEQRARHHQQNIDRLNAQLRGGN
jgi:hypothetical protein